MADYSLAYAPRNAEVKQDLVNHPSHYTSSPSGVEIIEVTREMPFSVGNAFKYIARCNLKGNKKQDLEKAVWYLKDVVENQQPYSDVREDTELSERVIKVALSDSEFGASLILVYLGWVEIDYEIYLQVIDSIERVISTLDTSLR